MDLQQQLLPGTIEHALHHLLDHQIDLSRLDTNYKNDTTGATAYPPAMLLKIILFAYIHGINKRPKGAILTAVLGVLNDLTDILANLYRPFHFLEK